MTNMQERINDTNNPPDEKMEKILEDIKQLSMANDGGFETQIHSILYPARGKLIRELFKCFKSSCVSSFDMLKLIIIVTKYLREEVINRHLLALKEIAFKGLILYKNLINQKMQVNILLKDILILKALSEMITEKLKKAVDKHNEIKQRIHAIQHKLNNKTTVPLFNHKVAACLNSYMKNVADIQKELMLLFYNTSKLYGQDWLSEKDIEAYLENMSSDSDLSSLESDDDESGEVIAYNNLEYQMERYQQYLEEKMGSEADEVNDEMNSSVHAAQYLSKSQEVAIKESLKHTQTGIAKLVTRMKFLKCKLRIYHAQQL